MASRDLGNAHGINACLLSHEYEEASKMALFISPNLMLKQSDNERK